MRGGAGRCGRPGAVLHGAAPGRSWTRRAGGRWRSSTPTPSRCGPDRARAPGARTPTTGWPPRSPSRAWPRSWCPPPFAAVVLHGVLPRLTARPCTGGRPRAGRGRWAARARPATAVPDVRAGAARWPRCWSTSTWSRWSRRCGRRSSVSERVLWGNVASARGRRQAAARRAAPGGGRAGGGGGAAAADRPSGPLARHRHGCCRRARRTATGRSGGAPVACTTGCPAADSAGTAC